MPDNTKRPLPIGITDFQSTVENYYYVDKTLLIKKILDDMPNVLLITRPRRFGKTLNMDMLRCFFEKGNDNLVHVFEKLKIWKCGKKYQQQQGRYPVIHFTFKDVKFNNWDKCYQQIIEIISQEFQKHDDKQEFNELGDRDIKYIKKIINKTGSFIDYVNSLKYLTFYLCKSSGIKTVILIDEYDAPIQQGYMHGFYDNVIEFIGNWMSGGLKDNLSMKFSVLTGILRVAKESIFSGLNNPVVETLFDEGYREYFGFTEEEIKDMSTYYNAFEKLDEIKEWYDGYNFSGLEIYNPWSVLNYFYRGCKADTYWLSTSSNDIINTMLQNATPSVTQTLMEILQGIPKKAYISSSIVYPNIKNNPDSLYSFLLMTGYLKSVSYNIRGDSSAECELLIPNKEIMLVYKSEILNQLEDAFPKNLAIELIDAIENNETISLQNLLTELMIQSISNFDTSNEAFYHGLMLGLCAISNTHYLITSNRESGKGRYDLQMKPLSLNRPGIVMEFKALTNNYKTEKSVKTALKRASKIALSQIEKNLYITELNSYGCKTILKYGIAFYKKSVEVVSKTLIL